MLHRADVDAWWQTLNEADIAGRYPVKMTEVKQQPWRIDFALIDPSGVLWRIAQNTD